MRWGRGYVPTASRDPVFLYDDVLVGIVPERNLNNRQPALHAHLIASAAPRSGEHVVHVGAGVGYYTAILHHLDAWRSATSFAGADNVRVICGDGARVEFDRADVIYVNAGATKPADAWLDRLTDGWRLILPLTAGEFPAGDIGEEQYFVSTVVETNSSLATSRAWRSFRVRVCVTQSPKLPSLPRLKMSDLGM